MKYQVNECDTQAGITNSGSLEFFYTALSDLMK